MKYIPTWFIVQDLVVITKRKRKMDYVFFSFPKDSNLRKVWTHYCKRSNFVPGPSHRLCSAHFSKDSFTQDTWRMAELGVNGKFQARLKPDAVPSMPLALSQQRGERWQTHSTSNAKSFRKA